VTRPVSPTAPRVRAGALLVAPLSSCVAFQLNASMSIPPLASIQEELNVTAAEVGLTQTAIVHRRVRKQWTGPDSL
jgi:hypothetical protein